MNPTFKQQQEAERQAFAEKQQREQEAFIAKQKRDAEREERRKQEANRYEQFRNQMIQMCVDEYDLNTEQAKAIFDKAWEEGHAFGENDVRPWVNELAELATKILKFA